MNNNYTTNFEVACKILSKLDGNTTAFSNYEVAYKILEILKNGGEEDTPNYLYFYANEDSAIEWTTDGSITPNLEYSTDGENFTVWDYSTISVPTTTTVYFRGVNTDLDGISNANNHFNIVGDMNVGGDIGSIIYNFNDTIAPSTYKIYYLFRGSDGITTICEDLTTANAINEVTNNHLFFSCKNLTTASKIMGDNLTHCGSMFNECENLVIAPEMNLNKNNTSCGWMFQNCDNLVEVPVYNTVNCPNFTSMFYGDIKLKTVGGLDLSSGTVFANMFSSCSALENITLTGSINYNIDFSPCKILSYDSVKSILTAASKTTKTTTSKTLKFNRTLTDNNGELAALITTCNSKRWTISGLTLN